MTCPDRRAPGRPATARQSLHRLVTGAVWLWLPRPWAAEWLALLGLILAELLPRIMPAVAIHHG